MTSTSELSPAESQGAPSPLGWNRWVIGGIVAAVIVAGLAWWVRPDGEASARELAAKAQLSKLGALVVLDAERKHVHSVNLSTLKSADTIDQAIALLPALRRIQSLNVDGTPFRDEHAGAVGRLGSLQDLVLSNTAVTDAGLEKLSDLSRLKTIHLVYTGVTNAGMPALGRLGALKIVDISGTKVTGNLEPLCELSNLNWLLVRNLTLDAAAFDAIGQFPALKRLTLQESTYPQEAVNQLLQKKAGLAIDR